MKISVIIATMNRPEDLRAAMESLVKQSLLPHEVLVVDQSADDRTRRAVDEMKVKHPDFSGRLKYFFQQEKSLVKARNRGIDEACGELITFLDDDAVLFENYLEKIDGFLKEHPEVGAVSGCQLLKAKPVGWRWAIRKALFRIFLISNCDGRMTPSGFGFPINVEKEIDHVIFVDMLSGCNMSFRKECMQGERFDEWFTGYGYREDADFSYRISRKTLAAMIPDAKLHHNQSTQSRLNVETLKKMEMKNHYHVFRKYRERNFFSKVLFAYSLMGIFLIDFLELLSKRDSLSFRKLKAGFSASFSVFGGH